MAHNQAVEELEHFLSERADRLLRTAVLLTGSREAGQDLLQAALERLLRHWRTLDGDPEAYLRRTLYNLVLTARLSGDQIMINGHALSPQLSVVACDPCRPGAAVK